MNKQFFSLLLIALPFAGIAQVGVGTNNVDPSAKFQIESGNKGFLQPRVALNSTTDITTIANPATGLMVYATEARGSGATAITPGVHYFDGTRWVRMQASVVNAGTGTTVTGSGTIESPYVINSTGGGGTSPVVFVAGTFTSIQYTTGISRTVSTVTVNGNNYTVAPAIPCGTITLPAGKWAVHVNNYCEIVNTNSWQFAGEFPAVNSTAVKMMYWLQNDNTVYSMDQFGNTPSAIPTPQTSETRFQYPPIGGGDTLFKGSATFIQPVRNTNVYHSGIFYINNTSGAEKTYYLFAKDVIRTSASVPNNAGPIYSDEFASNRHLYNRFFATKIE